MVRQGGGKARREVHGVDGCIRQTGQGFGGPTRNLGHVLTRGATESYKQGSDIIYIPVLCAESRSEWEQG